MDDVDEDVIPRSGPPVEDIDLSEEFQDFRFLGTATGNDVKIPKRGEKDFEPHATALQSNTLATSRQAMHNALSFQRVHAPKGVALATFHPDSNMAYAYNPKGSPLFARMGQVFSKGEDPLGDDGLRGQRMWFLPEEVIYLVERGTVDLRWPATEDDEDERGLPMSLQAAYAMFLGEQQGLGALIQWYDPTDTHVPTAPQSPSNDAEIRVTYDVWKPGSATFKKSDHGPPDFRIAVVDARETTAPSLQQLSSLLATLPYEPSKTDAQLYQKLKHGYKNVILAIVDQGVVSYLRISDAAFGREKLYERAGRGPGAKRGGRGGRGRGRGR
ncbi:hypothetical protein B0A55_01426 [Friedmanniomyces simplex]|uniref:tRNA-splicing endonuclease subunit Sen54 N-terminal domain-containing protein n=1 Tax=Friedmanniomyces simplex TaxID=329884 RepID=A0A4U0Y035_9PEZI|nr:hypothetical protein B0A55_01426 [Friedmanniomyces simplex]